MCLIGIQTLSFKGHQQASQIPSFSSPSTRKLRSDLMWKYALVALSASLLIVFFQPFAGRLSGHGFLSSLPKQMAARRVAISVATGFCSGPRNSIQASAPLARYLALLLSTGTATSSLVPCFEHLQFAPIAFLDRSQFGATKPLRLALLAQHVSLRLIECRASHLVRQPILIQPLRHRPKAIASQRTFHAFLQIRPATRRLA